jgi:hypothetical protein
MILTLTFTGWRYGDYAGSVPRTRLQDWVWHGGGSAPPCSTNLNFTQFIYLYLSSNIVTSQRDVVVFKFSHILKCSVETSLKNGKTNSAKFGFFLRSEGSKTSPGIIVHYIRPKHTANVEKLSTRPTTLKCEKSMTVVVLERSLRVGIV